MPNRAAKSRKQKRQQLNKKWKAKNPDAQQQNRWGR